MLAACTPLREPRAPNTPRGPNEREVLSVWNGQARSGATRETLHGVVVDDPYRALEIDSADTQTWIKAQTRRTEWALSHVEMPGAEARLSELLSIGTIERAVLGGDDVFFLRRDGSRERSALFQRTRDGRETLLVAPETYGERAAIDWFFPSTDGRYVAFGVSANGDERSTLRVLNVHDHVPLSDTIARTKWTSVAWLHDASGFYYTRYPAPGEPNYNEDEPESYFPRLFFHALGSDAARDPLVWSAPAPTDFPWLHVSADDRHLLIHNFKGWSTSDVFLLDRGAEPTARAIGPDTSHPLQTVIANVDALSNARVHQGAIYLHTNLNAPRGRIVRAELNQPSDRSRWQDVVPESEGTIEDWTLTKTAVAVHRIENVQSRLDLYPLTTTERSGSAKPSAQAISLPTIGAIDSLDGDADSELLIFGFSSFFVAPTLYALNDVEARASPIVRVAGDFDPSRFALSRETVTSADGTPVNVYLMHDARLIRDGNNPVLLYGYGGFSVSLLPSFSRSALYWLERGGVYAVANIRGGSEHGETWHRAGMLHQKERVFEDFEAVIAWLSDSKWSRPGRIAINGGSNGGLLMGAMLTRVPESVGAVVSGVGLYDMVRYTKFPPAALWVSEYGNPEQADDFATLHAYSPYHRVQPNTPYPFTLIETADHDTRVHWAHSTKFTARLQDAATDPTKVFFYMEKQLGHGRGTSLRDQVRRQLRTQAFLTRALGM